MSPFVRGRIIPETSSTGREKRTLDVLLWVRQLVDNDLRALDLVQILRHYLASIEPPVCAIDLWVPVGFTETAETLTRFGVPFSTVPVSPPDDDTRNAFGDLFPEGIADAAATALSCNADLIVADNTDWFP